MRYGSVCSGIEAATVAWHGLGWDAAWFSEIEPFPCAVLQHHYPTVPNYGDMLTLPARIAAGKVEAPDLFCGGTPCQAFSVAGLRQSLADDRGNLSLVFCEVANAIDAVRSARGERPSIVFWENVPGVLNTDDNAFGCFLAGLAGESVPLEPPGRKWTDAGVVLGPTRAVAWRVLDAQYFGVAQRRRRVFVVASARDDFDCAEVLFEREGVRRDFAPSRTARQIAPTIPSRSTVGGGLGTDFDCDGKLITARILRSDEYVEDNLASTVAARDYKSATDLIAHDFDARQNDGRLATYDSRQHHNPQLSDTAQLTTKNCAFVRGDTPLVAHAFDARQSDVGQYGDLSNAPDTDGHSIGVLFDPTQITCPTNGSNPQPSDPCHTLAKGAAPPTLATPYAVRRLTPRECERLQGFPDDYTAIPYKNKPAADCPDGPRYKALGNSWAVPVVRWIGARIDKECK